MSGRVMETINYFLANLIFLRLRIIADKYISYIIKIIHTYVCIYVYMIILKEYLKGSF